LSTASLNWIWVPAELTVAYGISSPSDTAALLFSTVTISGRASVRVLPWAASAWRARLMLKRFETRPKEMPPAGTPAFDAFGSPPKGRLTTLPPRGSPVVAEMGKSCESVRFGLAGDRLVGEVGLKGAMVPSGKRMPAKAGEMVPAFLPGADWKP